LKSRASMASGLNPLTICIDSAQIDHEPTLSTADPVRRFLIVLAVVAFVAALLVYAYDVVDEIVTPVFEDDFSRDSLLRAAMFIVLIAGMFWIVSVYEKTPVNHLPGGKKALVNFILCVGGLAFMGSCILLRMEHYAWFVVVLCSSVVTLRYARAFAKRA
jgi:hypothetical protein